MAWIPSRCRCGYGWSGIAVSCGIGHRCGLDPKSLWLWLWPAAAAPIQPLAWELPYTTGVALKESKKKNKKQKHKKKQKTKQKKASFLQLIKEAKSLNL